MKKRYLLISLLLIVVFALRGGSFELPFDDGPYVFWENDKPEVNFIKNDQVMTHTISTSKDGKFYLNWAPHIMKPVELKKSFPVYKTRYANAPEKFIVISDMHGNMDGTLELLLAENVIDKDYNWIYDGWLIIDGDILDRGEQTTELLWFLYHLWLQADDSENGKVIPILGNHETMSLSSRTHKVDGKYKKTCELMNMTYNELFGEKSFLGKWIRSWQTIAVIDSFLVMHGGFSPGLMHRFDNIPDINEAITSYYGNQPVDEELIEYLLSRNGPFWYRGYFYSEEKWEKSDQAFIDDILQTYELDKIIVGHTTFEEIAAHYNGKVISIDAGLKYQEAGKALLYENSSFKILNSTGQKTRLE